MLTLEEIKPCNKVRNLDHRNKITGIISIKILMNKTHQNCFLDSSCKFAKDNLTKTFLLEENEYF